MKKQIIILCLLLFYSQCRAATYYIDYVDGSDSNNGTSKSTTWKHAPGMQGCTGNCATKRNEGGAAGDQFILKGGVTWPNAVMPWDWYYGDGTTAAPIYFGVDQTWYSGGSWSRPILNAEGIKITPDSENVNNMMRVYGDGFIVDNIEFTGFAQLDNTYGGLLSFGTSSVSSQGIEIKNCYFHGWSHGGTATQNNTVFVSCAQTLTVNIKTQIHDCVWDGSDTAGDMGDAIVGSFGHFYRNYVSYIPNVNVSTNTGYIWGNTFRYIGTVNTVNESCPTVGCFDCTTHMNLDETYGIHYGFYNNLVEHAGGGATLIYYPYPTGSTSIFNNVIVNDSNQTMQLGALYMTAGNSFGYNIFNNTIQSTGTDGTINGGSGGGDGSKFSFAKIQNNHIVSSPISTSISMSAITTTTTQDHNLDQTAAQATSANYISGSTYPYYPPVDGATVDTGTSLSSICSGLSDVSPSLMATACGYDAALGVEYNATTHTVTYPKRTPIVRSIWDIGAYEYQTPGAFSPGSGKRIGGSSSGGTFQ